MSFTQVFRIYIYNLKDGTMNSSAVAARDARHRIRLDTDRACDNEKVRNSALYAAIR